MVIGQAKKFSPAAHQKLNITSQKIASDREGGSLDKPGHWTRGGGGTPNIACEWGYYLQILDFIRLNEKGRPAANTNEDGL